MNLIGLREIILIVDNQDDTDEKVIIGELMLMMNTQMEIEAEKSGIEI